jgi:hypothetical protein
MIRIRGLGGKTTVPLSNDCVGQADNRRPDRLAPAAVLASFCLHFNTMPRTSAWAITPPDVNRNRTLKHKPLSALNSTATAQKLDAERRRIQSRPPLPAKILNNRAQQSPKKLRGCCANSVITVWCPDDFGSALYISSPP